ncbi:MAG: succinate dehydrogenase assembly factor 2 [Gammaproteobacteria bacterium]|nr:succinate dehydrogenase assembly factor 2 [Gammaproteobacteria bacterium]
MNDDIARLKWQCRRGSKELDLLLQDYLEQHYPQADADEKSRFRALLELDDADLMQVMLSARLRY